MAFRPSSYEDLCACMKTRALVQIDKIVGTINGIQAEDGSGRRFNVRIQSQSPGIGSVTVFWSDNPSDTAYANLRR